MSTDPRDAWVRAYLEDVFNGHNLQSLDKYISENWLTGAFSGGKPGERRWETSSTPSLMPNTL